jgi:DNA topoisomerase-1
MGDGGMPPPAIPSIPSIPLSRYLVIPLSRRAGWHYVGVTQPLSHVAVPSSPVVVPPTSEQVAAAEAVGLNYVTDAVPGIRRKGVGRGFAYYDPAGTLIRDRAIIRRIRALAIPPAWTEVWICPDPEGHIQATARDAKGRKQYRYHPRFRAARDETKFGRMLRFSEILPRLRARLEHDMARSGLPRRKVLAMLVRLLEKTHIRVGNDEYARQNRSYGLTTLKRRHVAVRGDTLKFEFRGKSGVPHSVKITDRRIARIVQRCIELPGADLFQYLNGDGRRESVTSGDLNDYLREITGLDATAKDFRTWAGTMLAARALREVGPAASERDARRNVNKALDQVARRLGNTRAVCRKYYVHPALISAYMGGIIPPPPPELPPGGPIKRERLSAALRREEVVVLQFLQNHQARDEDEEDPSAAGGV